jgi:hypothetical protein
MSYETIIIFFEKGWTYPQLSNQPRAYWANRLRTLHQQHMAQGKEHADAIIACKREYDANRKGSRNIG